MGSSATDGDGKPPALPEVVRARLVELTAEVLPQVSRLPPPLRKVAGFAPGRRARLGATPIAVELDRSPGFREHVMTQLRIQHPELASLADAVPAAAEPVDLAAISWLARSEDWEKPQP